MTANVTSTSKFLSLVLRHQPELLGLTLQPNGWVSVEQLIEAAETNGRNLSRALINEVVNTSDKSRFSLSEDGQLIRANQGHSTSVALEFEQVTPPDFLFHGTAQKSITFIQKDGLQKMRRHHVHLSADRETARKVGKRHGLPVVLTVNAGAMAQDGFVFFLSTNGVWLTENVPPRYLTIP